MKQQADDLLDALIAETIKELLSESIYLTSSYLTESSSKQKDDCSRQIAANLKQCVSNIRHLTYAYYFSPIVSSAGLPKNVIPISRGKQGSPTPSGKSPKNG